MRPSRIINKHNIGNDMDTYLDCCSAIMGQFCECWVSVLSNDNTVPLSRDISEPIREAPLSRDTLKRITAMGKGQ